MANLDKILLGRAKGRNRVTLREALVVAYACPDGVAWAKRTRAKSFADLWAKCPDAAYMRWAAYDACAVLRGRYDYYDRLDRCADENSPDEIRREFPASLVARGLVKMVREFRAADGE